MTTLAQFSINLSSLNTPPDAFYRKPSFLELELQRPSYCFTNLSSRKGLICHSWNKLGPFKEKSSFLIGKNRVFMKKERWGCDKRMVLVKAGGFREKNSFLIGKNGILMNEKRMILVKLGAFREKDSFLAGKNGIFMKGERWGCDKRMVVVKFKQGFGFDGIGDGGGGGGGGGRDNSEIVRVLSNLVLAIGLTYLTMTGQLGWLLDAIVSVWLLAVLLPILGLGAFIWWAGRDIVQGTCPNCGNDFQIFKSTLNDEVQLCPFCTQPFSVVGDKFVRDPVTFSNQSTTFGQAFSDFSTRSKQGKESSTGVVDIEAEVKDAD